MKYFGIFICICVIAGVVIFHDKRKDPRHKITIPYIIALVLGILIILGFRYLLSLAF
jgi:hypothetical protein